MSLAVVFPSGDQKGVKKRKYWPTSYSEAYRTTSQRAGISVGGVSHAGDLVFEELKDSSRAPIRGRRAVICRTDINGGSALRLTNQLLGTVGLDISNE